MRTESYVGAGLSTAVCVLALSWATEVGGSTITAKADDQGLQNAPFTSENFWSVVEFSGPDGLFIDSFEIDLRAGGQNLSGFFDLAGGNTPFGPTLGTLTGLTASDVTFSPSTGTTPALTLIFTPGSFAAGDSLSFGADVDSIDSGDADGDSIGKSAVGFSVSLSDGRSFSTSFIDVDYDGTGGADDGISTATLNFADPEAIPEPATYVSLTGLVLCLGIGAWWTRRRRKAAA